MIWQKIRDSLTGVFGAPTGQGDLSQDEARKRLKKLIRQQAPAKADEDASDVKLFSYERDGKLDLDLYRTAQTLGNKAKLDLQWVPEEHIETLSSYVNGLGLAVQTGICHGTRRGNEQVWFRKHLTGAPEVIGTEISDTAEQFPHTIMWDFHEVKPEWLGATELVYSNSWDHSYDPPKAFRAWARCLSPGGVMLLDHGWNYLPDRVNALDPFGISEPKLVEMLNRECADYGSVVAVVDGGLHKEHPIRTIVFRATGSDGQ